MCPSTATEAFSSTCSHLQPSLSVRPQCTKAIYPMLLLCLIPMGLDFGTGSRSQWHPALPLVGCAQVSGWARSTLLPSNCSQPWPKNHGETFKALPGPCSRAPSSVQMSHAKGAHRCQPKPHDTSREGPFPSILPPGSISASPEIPERGATLHLQSQPFVCIHPPPFPALD